MADTAPAPLAGEPGDRVLDIVNLTTGEIASRMVVTDKSEGYIDRATMGMIRKIGDDWYVSDHVIGEDDGRSADVAGNADPADV